VIHKPTRNSKQISNDGIPPAKEGSFLALPIVNDEPIFQNISVKEMLSILPDEIELEDGIQYLKN
jgi:hypothetical protein